MTARLLLVRHGQIEANLTQHWHGTTDSPLTTEGIRQAAAVGRHLSAQPLDAVYASPLQRTRDTARAIAEAHRLPVLEDPRVIEYGIGQLEGTHYRALMDEHGFFNAVARDRHFAPPGGESLHAVVLRMEAALVEIARRHPGGRVAIVSHGAALGIVLGHLLESDPLAWTRYAIRNCSISEFELEPVPRLLDLNRVDHLA